MRADSHEIVKVVAVSGSAGWLVVGLCGLLSLSLLSCRKAPLPQSATIPDASAVLAPPDLSRCTWVEIRFSPSTLDFVCITPTGRLLLDQEEIKYLASAGPFIVDDLEAINALAQDIASSTYDRPVPGVSSIQYQIHFTCHDGSERPPSFTAIGNITEVRNTIVADGRQFNNDGIRLRLFVPQIVPFQLRVTCARNLSALRKGLRGYLDEKTSYPSAAEWYDAIVDRYQAHGYSANVDILVKAIRCPSACMGQCHYAMNVACEPNSPAGTVLLFESMPGRNQHGGPELFTFDNHDPKGGLVLLNDGTVKFIRTQEELKQLRWK
jgi:hypothetical protein